MKTPFLAFVTLLACAASLAAPLKLASPFGDHMVLQRGMPVPVWGTADPGAVITVEFDNQTKSATAGADGEWRVTLDPLTTSATPRDFIVHAASKNSEIENQKLTDVLVGEVWICGGQSNMERQLGLRSGQKPIINWESTAASANNPLIRQLYIRQTRAVTPQDSVEATWSVCTPENVVDFTAVGYFFARKLEASIGVPIGIIHSSWGGTIVEAWTSREGLKDFPEFNQSLDLLSATAGHLDEAKRLFNERLEAWYQANDPGSKEGASWNTPGLDTSGWETMNVPVLWEDAGHPGFDGVAWFRHGFEVPADWNGRDLELHLGAIDDIDTTWVNGTEVGTTSWYTTPRVYKVPATLLKPTGNVIAIRVLDTGGGGGLWDPKLPLSIGPADGSGQRTSLNGAWLVKFSTPLDPKNRPPADVNQSPNVPTVLYNAMIAPLIPYAIRGVTFYQGESNADRPVQYRTLFPAMIADWRKRWGEGDFPFLYVQIAPFRGNPPEIREAQFIALKNTKNTAMAVTIDIGDPDDIHPANKGPVGARLALAARALAYSDSIEYSGPIYETMRPDGPNAVLSFSHIGGGLVAPGGTLEGFTIAGADGVFHPADARIDGDAVVVSSPDVRSPSAVRYGWANVARGNLFNRAGLPASPFRTDVK